MPSLPCEAFLPWPLPLMGIVLANPAPYKTRRTGLRFPTLLRRAVVARACSESHLAKTSAQEYPDKRRIRRRKSPALGPVWSCRVGRVGPAVDTGRIVLYLGSSQ